MTEVEQSNLNVESPVRDCRGNLVDCLRVSVTDRCNLRCVYCRPACEGRERWEAGGGRRAEKDELTGRWDEEGSEARFARHAVLRFEEIVDVVWFLQDRYGLRAVRLTGGDPLARTDVAGLAAMLGQLGLDDLALTTNGQQLPVLADPLRKAGVSRVNVSLDTLDAARFARLTRGGRLDRTLAGIGAAHRAGFRPIKINTVVLRGENDAEVCDLVRFAMDRGLEIRFLELMAIGVAAPLHDAWFVSSHEVFDRLRRAFRLFRNSGSGRPVFDGAVHARTPERTRLYVAEDARGRTTRVGFISPETRPFCAGCRRLRLGSTGRLFGCLMHTAGVDLKPFLRAPDGPDFICLDRAVREVLAAKPTLRAPSSSRAMAAVGG